MSAGDDVQLQRLRQMTYTERWRAARALDASARRLKTAYLRQLHPDWTDEEIQREVRRVFMYVHD
ncbi:MAG: hypothetical protein KC776_25630 [Myxococcales bacterium]|nr:hypothetical protein [Myxococcales bacterium]MCB9579742.1 hypothetical protein [Polyangiaceae bacterium]